MTAVQVLPGRVGGVVDAVDAVVLEGVVRRHRGGRGIGPLDVQIAHGEQLGIVGPNGAGKTTLLRLLATLDRPQKGRLRWGAGSARAARRSLGLALDLAVEEETLSARQAAFFWCRRWLRDGAAARRAVDSALERFGLRSVADEPVAALSFGMRRRLGLVEALAHDPALALLDEPTAGLDPAGVDVLVAELGRRAAAGRTTVVASNDPGAVSRGCGRVLVLCDGLVVHDGSPGALRATVQGRRVVALGLGGPAAPADVIALGALAGVERVTPTPEGCEVQLGRTPLAALITVADGHGGRLRSLAVRDADLGDVAATARWREGSGALPAARCHAEPPAPGRTPAGAGPGRDRRTERA